MSQPLDSFIDVGAIKQKVKSREQIIDKLGLDLIILAGSSARGDANWWSDIDIFISLPEYKILTSSDQLAIIKKVSRLVYDLIDYDNIDINIIEELPIKIKFPVYTEGKILFVRDH